MLRQMISLRLMSLWGNPKYTENVRYSDEYEVIEGMKDYHDGKAKNISGVVKKDDRL